jgi:glutamine amidotransferase-like uncharacterized protein
MINALQQSYKITIWSEQDNINKVLSKADIVAFPGGIGSSDKFYKLFPQLTIQSIQNFVINGGYYLGICMGAYWASHYYFNILKSVEAVQYIKRPDTDIKRSYATVANVQWLHDEEEMFFYDGCSLIGNERKFKVIARYSNNDPMAIIQNNIGIIGCHPESEKFWYEKYNYIKQHWHHGRHHMLLLDFVNRLSSNQTTVINSRKY